MLRVRIDDIGASTKWYNQHGRKIFRFRGVPFFYFPIADWGFNKRLPGIAEWGPNDELTGAEWGSILKVFQTLGIKPIVAVTACWVDEKNQLIPFPEKFPDEAAALKVAAASGAIEIANHGLTHCIVGQHLPRLSIGNRYYHREFYDWLPEETQVEHISRSQAILEQWCGQLVRIFVPPGNIWSWKTYLAIKPTHLKTVISARYMSDTDRPMDGVEFISDRSGFINLHDRELKLRSRNWLRKRLMRCLYV